MTLFNCISIKNKPEIWKQISDLPLVDINYKDFMPPDLSTICSSEPYDLHKETHNKHEDTRTAWLISLFNEVFKNQNVTLTHAQDVGKDEPEYLPAIDRVGEEQPAKICFAHGYFASALHEISHWTIAGKKRRQLADFGYWYAPDGRSEQQQQDFEKMEIKPQAIECLLTLACGNFCGYDFQVSQDNLFADFDTHNSTFEADVFALATDFLQDPSTLPKDARTLLTILWRLCSNTLI